ncbi:hypothetical protein PanWU01x14_270990, partial [Parasponia andersonii]
SLSETADLRRQVRLLTALGLSPLLALGFRGVRVLLIGSRSPFSHEKYHHHHANFSIFLTGVADSGCK